MGEISHQPVEIDPHTLEQSRNLWRHFTEAAKYGVIAVSVLLLIMWALLV